MTDDKKNIDLEVETPDEPLAEEDEDILNYDDLDN